MILENNNQEQNNNFDFTKFSSSEKNDKNKLSDDYFSKSKRSLDKKTKSYIIIIGICIFVSLILYFLSLSKNNQSLPPEYNRPAVENIN
jgi:hypothetical protein